MAVPGVNYQENPLSQDEEFVERSYLSYFVPSETKINLEQAFKDLDLSQPVLDLIPKRHSLFFDEAAELLLILRTPWADAASLRSQLGRLTISVEASITNRPEADRDNQALASNEVIFSGSVEDIEDPFIIVDESEDSDGDDSDDNTQHVYAMWKLPVFLSRPRFRMQNPLVVFTASAGLKPDSSPVGSLQPNGGYLTSGIPSGLNLLESFSTDPGLGGKYARLSALRVSRVAPLTNPKELMRSLRTQPHLAMKIVPALHTRLRFSRANSVPISNTIIALLEVDFTPFFDCNASIDKIALEAKDTQIEHASALAGLTLPLTCSSRDHVTFIYRLTPNDPDDVAKNPVRSLGISVHATAHMQKDVCTPTLMMAWTTPLDFTVPVNPGFGPATQPIQRAHRPSQLSIGGGEASLRALSISRPDALPSLEATARTEATIPDLGITMTFCGPTNPVHPGDTFLWTIYVVNRTVDRSSSTHPRRLALHPILKRRRNDLRIMRPPSTSGGPKHGPDGGKIADAVLDDNIVHAMQRSSLVDSTDVVCLSPDTRIGPLAPGACYVAELKFLALREGILNIDAVRVVDVGSQEHVDVRELPTIFVEKKN